MLDVDLLQHARRAADMPPPPFFASYVMATATTTSSASATEVATDVPHAAFLYPAALLTVNNIDVVQVTYETVWKSVNLTVFCEINEEASEFALAKIGQSKHDHGQPRSRVKLMYFPSSNKWNLRGRSYPGRNANSPVPNMVQPYALRLRQ